MIKGDRDYGNNGELDQIYSELKEFIPLYGWPKWPPKEVPSNSEWYKNQKYILPKKPHMPQNCFITIDGTPHAGKTSTSEIFASNYQISDKHKLVQINPDNLYVTGAGGIMYFALDQIFPSSEDELPTLMEKNDWVTNLWHQFTKQLYWEKRIHELIQSAKVEKTSLTLGQRGPVDQTIFCYAHLTHTTDPDFTIPTDQIQFAQDQYLQTFIGSQCLVQFLDSVIFIGTDKNEALQRRKCMNLTQKGIANSPFFEDYSAWIGYWIENVWLNLYDIHGTGLLVLDGTKSIDENIEILSTYINESKRICLPDTNR